MYFKTTELGDVKKKKKYLHSKMNDNQSQNIQMYNYILRIIDILKQVFLNSDNF